MPKYSVLQDADCDSQPAPGARAAWLGLGFWGHLGAATRRDRRDNRRDNMHLARLSIPLAQGELLQSSLPMFACHGVRSVMGQ